MPINLEPGPAKGVPLEGLKKALSLMDFDIKPGVLGPATILGKSVFVESLATANSGSAIDDTVQIASTVQSFFGGK